MPLLLMFLIESVRLLEAAQGQWHLFVLLGLTHEIRGRVLMHHFVQLLRTVGYVLISLQWQCLVFGTSLTWFVWVMKLLMSVIRAPGVGTSHAPCLMVCTLTNVHYKQTLHHPSLLCTTVGGAVCESS